MNMLKRTIFIILILIILLLGAGNYANAQTQNIPYYSTVKNRIDEYSRAPPTINTFRNRIKGRVIRAPPLTYMMQGDTLYIGATQVSVAKDNFIFEFVAKPQDKKFIQILLETEIKDKDEQDMYFRVSENWNGGPVKTDMIQFGQTTPYVFEAANKKEP